MLAWLTCRDTAGTFDALAFPSSSVPSLWASLVLTAVVLRAGYLNPPLQFCFSKLQK